MGGLSGSDRGVCYGDGIFRTLRVRLGLPVTWALHYKKLVDDCNVLGIVCPSAEILLDDIGRLFTEYEDAVAKIIITRGEGPRGYLVADLLQPTRIVIKTLAPEYPKINFEEGVELHICTLRLGSQPRLAGIKHLNRLENVLARMEWSDSHIADGLLLDEQEHVIECTMSNVFLRFGKTLLTPDLKNCGVAGITRQRILEAVSSLGYQAEIAQIPYAKMPEVDEFIICNSLYGAWQVRTLNSQKWPQQGLAAQLRNVLQD